jgi:tetratricopeptide (TPR) repeat protein
MSRSANIPPQYIETFQELHLLLGKHSVLVKRIYGAEQNQTRCPNLYEVLNSPKVNKRLRGNPRSHADYPKLNYEKIDLEVLNKRYEMAFAIVRDSRWQNEFPEFCGDMQTVMNKAKKVLADPAQAKAYAQWSDVSRTTFSNNSSTSSNSETSQSQPRPQPQSKSQPTAREKLEEIFGRSPNSSEGKSSSHPEMNGSDRTQSKRTPEQSPREKTVEQPRRSTRVNRSGGVRQRVWQILEDNPLIHAVILAVIIIGYYTPWGTLQERFSSSLPDNRFESRSASSAASASDRSTHPEKARRLVEQGNSKLDNQRYQGAIADYTEAIELDPNNATAYFKRGLAYDNIDKYQAAIADYTKAIELDSRDSASHNNRGAVYSRVGDKQSALRDYDTAIEIDPKYTVALKNRGNTHFDLGNYQAAIVDYERAIELDPKISLGDNYAIAYENLGDEALKQEDWKQAIQDYSKAISLGHPNPAEVYGARGWVYAEQGDYEAALLDANAVLRQNQKDAYAYDTKGYAYHHLGNYQAALENFKIALALKPDLTDAYEHRGDTYRELGNQQAAIADFRKAIEGFQSSGRNQSVERVSEKLSAVQQLQNNNSRSKASRSTSDFYDSEPHNNPPPRATGRGAPPAPILEPSPVIVPIEPVVPP